jgi:predicted Zn finger-like uncharacterized protein
VIVECDRCHARYHYDEDRFGGKASKKLRCSKCRTIFEVFNTRAYEAQPPVRPIVPDATRTRRGAPGEEGRGSSLRVRPVPPPAIERRASPGELKLPSDRKLSLAVIAGPDAGRIFSIDKPRVTIGREGVDLALDDPELSRQHAALEVRGEEVTLRDLGSTNGTMLGEQPVSEAPLENQMEFTVGASTLMLIVTST